MSETPRTDVNAGYPDASGHFRLNDLGFYVEVSFARQLERELAAANARIAELESQLRHTGQMHATLAAKLEWLNAQSRDTFCRNRQLRMREWRVTSVQYTDVADAIAEHMDWEFARDNPS